MKQHNEFWQLGFLDNWASDNNYATAYKKYTGVDYCYAIYS